MFFFSFQGGASTPDFMNKKHLNFGQGLEFLKFGQVNRGPNQQNRRKTEEKIRKNEGNQRKFDKKFRDRDPYFLFKSFSFNIFSVFGPFTGSKKAFRGVDMDFGRFCSRTFVRNIDRR